MPFLAPAFAAIGAAIGVSAGTVALVAINLGVSATMSVLQRKKMKAAQQKSDGGIRVDRKLSGGINPRSTIFGFYTTAGAEVCPPMSRGQVGDTPNLWLTYVISLSDIPIQGITRVIIDGEYAPIDWEDTANWGAKIGGKYIDRAWIRFHNGTQTAADSFLVRDFSDYPDRPWSENHIGRGCAYAVVTFQYDAELFRGEPNIKFECQGARLYDLRKDSSRGGSGAHRVNLPNTWEYTENPYVITYNIKYGIRLGDGRIWGGKAQLEDLPLANWAAAMNIADEIVAGQPRYRAGYEVFFGEDKPDEVIDHMMIAGSGEVAEIGGSYKVRAGGPALPVAFLTDGDFLVSRPSEYDPFPSIAASRNTLNGTFPHPGEMWNAHDAPQRTVQAYIDQDDGEVIATSIAFSAVPFPGQVQRLMNSWLRDDRRWRNHVSSVGPYAFHVEPLDTIEWTSLKNGYIAKLFEIEKTRENLYTLCTGWNFREVDPNDYSWTPDFELPDAVAPGGWRLPVVQAVPGFNVAPIAVRDANGVARRPGLQISWTPNAARDATALEITVIHIASNQTFRKSITDIGAGVDVYDQGLLPDQLYRVFGQYRARRPTQRTSPWEVRTGTHLIGTPDLTPEFINQIQDIAGSAGIPSGPELPTAGEFPNQLFMLVPPGELYRWDAVTNGWVTALYAGIPDGSLHLAKFAQGIEPVTLADDATSLPTTRSTSAIFWRGDLYRWNGTAYVKTVPTIDLIGTITSAQIGTGAVLTTRLADNAVNVAKLADGAVAAAKLANNAVTADKIAALAVNSTKIAESAITTTKIADLAIASGKLALNAVTSDKIAALAVNAAAIAANAVTTAKIADDAISESKLADAAATNAKVAANAITSTQVASNAITTPKIVAGAITAGTIAAGAIEAGKISAGAVTAGTIAAGAVSAGTIAANAVTATQIAAGTITAAEIASNAITADKINAAAVTAGKIAANSITATQISAGAITTNEIATSAITSTKINAGSVFAEAIATNAITAIKVNAGAIEAGKIAASAVTAGTVAANAITATTIAADAVTAAKIFTGAVTADAVAANAITAIKLNANAVTADKIAANAITADKIEANAVTAGKIEAGAITVGKIAAGAIRAQEIAVGAIIASKLAIADFTNMVPDDQLQDIASWIYTTSTTSPLVFFTTAPRGDAKSIGAWVYDVNRNTGRIDVAVQSRNFFPVTPGDELFCSAQMIRVGGTRMNVVAQLVFFDKNDAILATNAYAAFGRVNGTANTGNPYSGSVTVPAGAFQARIRFYVYGPLADTDGNVHFMAPNVRLKNKGELIVDGTITANKIEVGSITTDLIAAGTIVASKIAAGTIAAVHLATNSVTAEKINVGNLSAISANMGTITAGVIRSGTAGERFVLTPTGLSVFDNAGVLRVRIGQL